jgi:hypothetical protein
LAEGDPTPLSLMDRSLASLENQVRDLEGKLDEIPVLRKEVQLLSEANRELRSAVYTAAGSLLVTGVLGVLVALIVKGVLGG